MIWVDFTDKVLPHLGFWRVGFFTSGGYEGSLQKTDMQVLAIFMFLI